MNSERRLDRIEALLESLAERQAKAEARMDRYDARMERTDARMEQTDAHVAAMDTRFNKRMDALRKLVETGMKILVKIGEAQKESDHKLNALIDAQERLAESQRQTDRRLQAILDSLKKGRNGRR